MIPASQPACVLVRDQVSMNCGRSAGTVENPARPRISAPHIAITIAAEGLSEISDLQVNSLRIGTVNFLQPNRELNWAIREPFALIGECYSGPPARPRRHETGLPSQGSLS